MKKSAYTELAEVENSYWWFVGRKKIIARQLDALAGVTKTKPRRILNVGAGTGGTIPMLEQFGTVTNADPSRQAIHYLERSGYQATHFDGKTLPFEDAFFDIVVALDVLEHTGDDGEALREWFRVLKPGGSIVITVPAYQWLWSDHDEALMHYRRYTTSSLRQVVVATGAPDIHKLGYMIVFSLPLIVGYRALKKLGQLFFRKTGSAGAHDEAATDLVSLPGPVNRLFIWLLAVEGRLQTHFTFPFGTSVILVAQTRKNSASDSKSVQP